MRQHCSFNEGNAVGAGGLTSLSYGTVELPQSIPGKSSFKSAASFDAASNSLTMESKKQTLHVSLPPAA